MRKEELNKILSKQYKPAWYKNPMNYVPAAMMAMFIFGLFYGVGLTTWHDQQVLSSIYIKDVEISFNETAFVGKLWDKLESEGVVNSTGEPLKESDCTTCYYYPLDGWE